MTNREKFKETFGFELSTCIVRYLPDISKMCLKTKCEECTYDDWWEWKYREGEHELSGN